MLERLKQFAAPPVFDDRAKTRQAALLNAILLGAFSIVSVVGLIQLFISPPEQRWRIGLYAAVVALALGARWLAGRGHLRAAAWLVTGGVWLIFQVAAYGNGGLHGFTYLASIFVVMLANLLLGGPATVVYVVLSILSGGVLAYLEAEHLVPPPFQSSWLWWIQFAALFSISALATHLVANSLKQAARQAENELSERQRTQAQLVTTEANYRALLENLPIITFRFTVTEEDRLTYISPHVEDLLGLTASEILGDPASWMSRLHPDDRPKIQAAIAQSHADRQGGEIDFRLIAKDGAIHWFQSRFTVSFSPDGQIYADGYAIDVTARKEAEEARRRSEERFALATQASNEGLWDHNIATGQTYVSPRWEAMLGFEPGGFSNLPGDFETLIHPDDLGHVQEVEAASLAGQLAQYQLEFRLRHIDGHYVWVESHAIVVRDPAGKPVRVVGAHQDITEQKKTQEVIRQSGLKYQALFDSAEDGIFVMRDGLFVDCNSRALAMFACGRSQILGQSPARFSTVMQPNGRSSSLASAERMTAALSGTPQSFEWRHMRADGVPFDAEVNLTAVELDGHPHLLAQVRDVSERKLAQTRLMEAEARYRLLVEQVPAITYVIGYGPDAPASYVSPQIEAVLGFSPTEWLADPEIWEQQLHPDDRERVRADEARNIGQDNFIAEYRIFAKNGREVWLHDESRRVYDEHGQYQYAQGIQYDITERKQAEAAARRYAAELEQAVAERTADLSRVNAELERASRSKDEFLASMSHELRTPLNAILALTESLEEGTYGLLTDRQTKPLRTVTESGHHLLALINDLLDLAKIEAGKLELQVERVEIEAVCEASLRLVRQQASQKQQSLSMNLDKMASTLKADPRALKQILVNLLSNAVKFTPEGGQIGLNVDGDAAHNAIRFTVWDTGIGIAPEDSMRLFQPFVQLDTSLARQYGGTGLGLALVYRLTEMHGGSVSLSSAPGKGSRFEVALPWDPGAPETQAAPAAPIELHIARALVVEDTPVIADQLARYLGETGAQVTVCSAGEAVLNQAIALQPQVIILDILLPDVSGWEILTRLKSEARTRAIPVIAVTALNDRSRGLSLGASEYLVKPISRPRLFEALQRALNRVALVESTAAGPDSTRPLVLLAEDNPDNQTVYVDYLAAKGYRVILAMNGQEAVERARAERPDLILMDVQMPVMDGLEATRQIRADAALNKLPIIAVTGLAMPGDGERCLAAGANDYLTKPVGLKHLINVIQTHLPVKAA